MTNRNEFGRFSAKSSQPRQVRSVRATDDVWDKLNAYADLQGLSVADVLEKWVYSLADPSPSTELFPTMLRQAWEAKAREQVGDNLYGHPVTLKVIFEGFSMPWDDFLEQVSLATRLDGFMELVGLRGHNYQVGDRRVAAITYHQ